MKKYKILGIAPYSELELLMKDAAKKYENIELYTFTGYYTNAIEFASAYPHENFDIIISRGGTADLIRLLNDIPVVNIPATTFDLFRVIKQALQCSSKAVLVSYPFVIKQAKLISQFLQLDIPTISFNTPEEIEAAVKEGAENGYDLIVGGAATKEFALKYNLQFHLITSSLDSVVNSFEQAIQLCQLLDNSVENNRLFHSALDRASSSILIFDSNSDLRFANVAARQMLNRVKNIDQLFLRMIKTLQQSKTIHLIKKINNQYFNVDGCIIHDGQSDYYLFELHFRATAFKISSFIQLESREEVQRELSLTDSEELYIKPLSKIISVACESQLPVLIQGEIGTHKGLIARYIHNRISSCGTMFLRIKCNELTEKNWDSLLTNVDSPLYDTGHTVYFERIDLTPHETQEKLAAFISDTHLNKRHRLLCSCCRKLDEAVSQHKFSSRLFFLISGIVINVPSLAEHKEDIAYYIDRMLPQYNAALGKSIVGIDPKALNTIIEFDWPLNLVQLEKVIRQLVATSQSYYISAEEVEKILKKETAVIASDRESIDLSMPLSTIEKSIINRVLREENNNLSATAKRLGIGRSTLWRKLQS